VVETPKFASQLQVLEGLVFETWNDHHSTSRAKVHISALCPHVEYLPDHGDLPWVKIIGRHGF
jgi:hypothetical protein